MINPLPCSLAPSRSSAGLALTVMLLAPGGLVACGPAAAPQGPGKSSAQAAAKPARKCPDPNLRDQSDPCAADYLAPYKPRSSRERF